MYFALSAIIAAGLLGLQSGQTTFPQVDLQVNPSTLSEEERAQYGVTQKLPGRLEDAMAALKGDGELREALAQGLVEGYLVMKRSEGEMLRGMGEGERRVWMMERY